ncbi:MAG: SEL1-like repeat protein [Polyangiaceae bacterium]|nr:SEL1-like repeat protein [Polyangiaceae bacterium]
MRTRRLGYTVLLATLAGGALAACGSTSTVGLHDNPTCDGGNLKDCDTRCGSNEARACYRLGWFYEMGQGVPRNVKKALELYAKACDANMGVSCRALGYLYNGAGQDIGVDVNKKLSSDYYARACKLGIAAACYSAPTMVTVGAEKKTQGTGSLSAPTAAPETPSTPSTPNAPSTPSTPSQPSAPSAPTAPSLPGG